jgi:hypothetical protein
MMFSELAWNCRLTAFVFVEDEAVLSATAALMSMAAAWTSACLFLVEPIRSSKA